MPQRLPDMPSYRKHLQLRRDCVHRGPERKEPPSNRPAARTFDLRVDAKTDSLRFYLLGSSARHRIEHVGCRTPTDIEGPLIL